MVGGCISRFARCCWQNAKHALHNWMWIILAVITTLYAMCAHMSSECLEITKYAYLQYVPKALHYYLHIDTFINDRLSYDGNGQRWTIHFTDYSFWTACAFVQVLLVSILLIWEPDEKQELIKAPILVAIFAALFALSAAFLAGSEFFLYHQIASQVSLFLWLSGDYLLYLSARKRLQALQNTGAGTKPGGKDSEIDALHARTKRMVMIIWGIDIPIIMSFFLINCYVYVHHSYETSTYPKAEVVAAEFFYYGATALQLFLANVAIIALSIVSEYEAYKSKISIGQFIVWQFLFVKPSSYVSDFFTKTGE